MRSSSKSGVYFFYQIPVAIRQRTVLKKFVASIFKKEGYVLKELNYVFCSDKYLLTINQQYLKHDEYTDIITFNLSDTRDEIKGEIYISVERVRENARIHGVSITAEFKRVIFHGALHLCGYKDKSSKEKKLMRQMEEEYLKRAARIVS